MRRDWVAQKNCDVHLRIERGRILGKIRSTRSWVTHINWAWWRARASGLRCFSAWAQSTRPCAFSMGRPPMPCSCAKRTSSWTVSFVRARPALSCLSSWRPCGKAVRSRPSRGKLWKAGWSDQVRATSAHNYPLSVMGLRWPSAGRPARLISTAPCKRPGRSGRCGCMCRSWTCPSAASRRKKK
eukprot:1352187-Pyramimonas_sp.AAC.1